MVKVFFQLNIPHTQARFLVYYFLNALVPKVTPTKHHALVISEHVPHSVDIQLSVRPQY